MAYLVCENRVSKNGAIESKVATSGGNFAAGHFNRKSKNKIYDN